MPIIASFLPVQIALFSFLLPAVVAWGETELYAYRTDVEDIDFQFYRLCSEEKGPNVRLVWGESCGTGYTPRLNWVLNEEPAYMREGPLEEILSAQRYKSSDDISRPVGKINDYFRREESRLKPGYSLVRAKSWMLKSQGVLPLSITLPKDDGVSKTKLDWRDERYNNWKVVLSRPTLAQAVPSTPLLFDSEMEFGTYFSTFGRRKVDPILDIGAMADPETGARFILTACKIASGGTSTILQLYLRRRFETTGKKGYCFPIQLTRSKNKLYHAKDLWCESQNSKYFAGKEYGFEYSPSYNMAPFMVKQTGGGGVLAVVDRTDPQLNYLLEFSDDDCGVHKDHINRYMPVKKDRSEHVYTGDFPRSLKNAVGWAKVCLEPSPNEKDSSHIDEFGIDWHQHEKKGIVRVYPDDGTEVAPLRAEKLEDKPQPPVQGYLMNFGGEEETPVDGDEEAEDGEALSEKKIIKTGRLHPLKSKEQVEEEAEGVNIWQKPEKNYYENVYDDEDEWE